MTKMRTSDIVKEIPNHKEILDRNILSPSFKASLPVVFIILSSFLLTLSLYFRLDDYRKVTNIFTKIDGTADQCTILKDEQKFDCFPVSGGNELSCKARGCCWVPIKPTGVNNPLGVPWCFYPKGYSGYTYLNVTPTANGLVAFMNKTFSSSYPNDINLLQMDVEFQTESRLRIKIFDPLKERYEPEYPKLKVPSKTPPKTPEYNVVVNKNSSGFVVKRSNSDVIFDAQEKGGFIYSDQFIQLSAELKGNIYGLGEHQSTFQLNSNWSIFTMLNQDVEPTEELNLYGSHPFYLVVEPNGSSHGVFLRNSNAMDVVLQPLPAITFRTIGGILDFYFFTGPSPGAVVQQYLELIGKPNMPPYWSLGFHLCRFGYKNVSHIQSVLNRTLAAGIPVDTQWVDIDYMVNKNDFTLDNSTFGDLPELIDELHRKGMHFVPILDPGISAGEENGTYPPYDTGLQLGVFVKNQDGTPFVGKVWNKNSTVFPDFSNLKTFVYWTGLIHNFHNRVPFDGLWIDMNEPSNFLDGSFTGCPNNSLENPPYVPGGGKLSHKTICMSAMQALGPHYNLHNLYGISEARATNRALKEILQVRPFIITRSTFPGVGHYSGHWSGDVASTWHDMKRTISQMLSFSLYGVPMMGSDICGFNGNTTKYLCLRWSQLGAFYPFSRNHNTDDGIDQDPVALGQEVADAAKSAMTIRYMLLPYLYTLFWKAHTNGETVARPLFFEFPGDPKTHAMDESFLWGCCLLIVPVLEENATTVKTYLPSGRWYDWYTFLGTESSGTNIALYAPTKNIPLLIRGGTILPTQQPSANTALSRSNNFTLLAAFASNLTATGSLYWDDGEDIHVRDNKTFGFVEFVLTPLNLTSSVSHWEAKEIPKLSTIKILGFIRQIKQAFINGTSTPFNWNSTSLVLSLDALDVLINLPFVVTWS